MRATTRPHRDRQRVLHALADVVFGNPFSAQRADLIGRLVPDASAGDREALARVAEPRLGPWLRDGAPGWERLEADDRRLLETAFLYVCYHLYVAPIDALIERQATHGGSSLTVPFAGEAIAGLAGGGLSEARTVNMFGFFFQLRRAFYFIHGSLAGECESMRRLREALWNNVFTHDMRGYEAALWNRMEDFSTLLLGETGTGKGSAAAAIGRSAFIPYLPGERRFAANFAESFIAINLSQFPEALIESELFGHRKGAFTGAIDHHQGVFERCSAHGALFLDEIGEVSIPVQIKLLQVLQERTFTPLGSHDKKRFSGRVIAATNRPLGQLRRDGRFRDDFFYRLCSDVQGHLAIILPASTAVVLAFQGVAGDIFEPGRAPVNLHCRHCRSPRSALIFITECAPPSIANDNGSDEAVRARLCSIHPNIGESILALSPDVEQPLPGWPAHEQLPGLSSGGSEQMGTKKGAAGSACCRCSFTGRRGENLRKERDDYYRHLAAHPDAELLPLA